MNLKLLVDLFLNGGIWGLGGGIVGYILGLLFGGDPLTIGSIGFWIGFASPLWLPLFKKS
jgi:hypothetical protein